MKINDTPGNWTLELTMESLNIPAGYIYPAFVFGTLAYVIILFIINSLPITPYLHTLSSYLPTSTHYPPTYLPTRIHTVLLALLGNKAYKPWNSDWTTLCSHRHPHWSQAST